MPLAFTLGDHKFTLSNDCLKAMATTLANTKVKERGNTLCVPHRTPAKVINGRVYVGEIVAGREHIGGPGSITERNCPAKVKVGHFHTHPGSSAEPSWWDAYSIVAQSWQHVLPHLGCRGGKGIIQCQTVRRMPLKAEVLSLKKSHTKKRATWAKDDPTIAKYLTEGYSFLASKIPEIINPPALPSEFMPFGQPAVQDYGTEQRLTRYGVPAELWNKVIEMDRDHSLEELRQMCRQRGLPTSGDKKRLASMILKGGTSGE